MRLSKSLIKADIIAAHQAIEYFDHNGVKDIKNVAAYHLQRVSYVIYISSLVFVFIIVNIPPIRSILVSE